MFVPNARCAVILCLALKLMNCLLDSANAVSQPNTSSESEGNREFFEGDITGIDPAAIASSVSRNSGKNGLIYELAHWIEGKVPYIIGDGFNTDEQFIILGALDDFSNRTCILFVPRDEQRDYVNIQPAPPGVTACGSSDIGRRGNMQYVNISEESGCMRNGIIQHELMHAVGFFHEQARVDRDTYVEINLSYLASSDQIQFQKYNAEQITAYGFPYDFGSVMHYPRDAFALNPTSWTIRPRQQYRQEFESKMGQREGLSSMDVMKINAMYKCPQTVSLPPISGIPPQLTAITDSSPPTTTRSAVAEDELNVPYTVAKIVLITTTMNPHDTNLDNAGCCTTSFNYCTENLPVACQDRNESSQNVLFNCQRGKDPVYIIQCEFSCQTVPSGQHDECSGDSPFGIHGDAVTPSSPVTRSEFVHVAISSSTLLRPTVNTTPKKACISQGADGTINCQDGKIMINWANWGVNCSGFTLAQIFCSGNDVTEQVKVKCQSKHSCELFGSSQQWGEPCHGWEKNLAVEYYCTSD